MTYNILVIMLIISLITDIRKRKILNIITFPAIFIGLIYYTVSSGFGGLIFSSKGLLIGFLILLIPYLLGGMGAGDVKLMAAIGALAGTSFVLESFFYTAIIGGLISIILIMKDRGARSCFQSPIKIIKSLFFNVFYLRSFNTRKKNNDAKPKITIPYGVPIALGTLCAAVIGV